LVIDQPGSIGTLAVQIARRRKIPVAYIPGLVMRRASQLYPGEAKTDRKDSFVIADTARIHQTRVHWLTANDELLEELRVLGGYDDDLAHDRTRVANRLRDLLLQMSPAVERVLGRRLDHPASWALLTRYPTLRMDRDDLLTLIELYVGELPPIQAPPLPTKWEVPWPPDR
jgi:hypothetical protein